MNLRTMPSRHAAPLLPTHGAQRAYTSRKGGKSNVVLRITIITIVSAACVYGGFAWVFIGSRTPRDSQGSVQPVARRNTLEQHQPHSKFKHAPDTAARLQAEGYAGQHQASKGPLAHEASGDLHHPGVHVRRSTDYHFHPLDDDSATSHHPDTHHLNHELGADSRVRQQAADAQHLEDLRQQAELANVHAPSTTTTTTTQSQSQAVTSPSQQPQHSQQGSAAGQPVTQPAVARKLEVEQMTPELRQHQQHLSQEVLKSELITPSTTTPTQQQPTTQQQAQQPSVTHPHVEVEQVIHPSHPQQQETVHAPVPHAKVEVEQVVHPSTTTTQSPDRAQQPIPRPATGFYMLSARNIDGVEQPLSQYMGKVTLVVNVASACGYTDENYKGLQAIYDKYHDFGLEILAFPCNQFGSQEPASEPEIKNFCSTRYHVRFPLFSKIEVNGANTHPVFKYLKQHAPVSDGGGGGEGAGEDIGWNFYKFLVDKSGRVVKRWNQRWNGVAVEQAVYEALLH